MSAAPAPSQRELLIPHLHEPMALLAAEGGAWRLPRVTVPNIWEAGFEVVNAEVRRALGLDVVVLACWSGSFASQVVVELDNRGQPAPLPSGLRWANQQALAELALAVPEQAELLRTFLAELQAGAREQRPLPWARPGWHDEASAWIAEQLAQLGTPLTAPVEQVKCWGISCVLRAPTSVGPRYFKVAARLPLFVDEPALLETLAALYPGQVPSPLCREPGRGWMLLAPFGRALDRDGTSPQRAAMLRAFARLQRDSAGRIEQLLAGGCLDRRLEVLSGQLAALVRDEQALAGLEHAERAAFWALLPRLQQRCAELAACGLPATLVHGDLHLGNVALHGAGYLFFDWTDACIAHPLFDLLTVYQEQQPELQRELRDAYLAEWAAELPAARLLEAFELARPLCDLHQVISYWQIAAGLDAVSGSTFADALRTYLRRVLSAFHAD